VHRVRPSGRSPPLHNPRNVPTSKIQLTFVGVWKVGDVRDVRAGERKKEGLVFMEDERLVLRWASIVAEVSLGLFWLCWGLELGDSEKSVTVIETVAPALEEEAGSTNRTVPTLMPPTIFVLLEPYTVVRTAEPRVVGRPELSEFRRKSGDWIITSQEDEVEEREG